MQHHNGGGARRRVAAAAVAALVVLGAPTPASAAAPSGMQELLAADPAATRLSPTSVSWDGGAVVLVFPGPQQTRAGASPVDREQGAARSTLGTSLAAAPVDGCPSGWSCLYEHAGYTGRRLQFADCGFRQSLAAYGFDNQASSWVNNRSRSTKVWDSASGFGIIWTELAGATSANVGAADNDRASSISLDC